MLISRRSPAGTLRLALSALMVLPTPACTTHTAPPPDPAALAELIPEGGGWRLDALQPLRLNGGNQLAVAFASRPTYEGPHNWEGQAVVYRYEGTNRAPWVLVWRSPRLTAYFPPEGGGNPFSGLYLLPGRRIALATAVVNQGGASAVVSRVLAFAVAPDGQAQVVRELEVPGADVRVDGNQVAIRGDLPAGTHVLELVDGAPGYRRIPPSQEPFPPGAVPLRFVLTRAGIAPAEGATVRLRVGETVVLVPQPGETAAAWDSGRIEAYTDAWNGPPVVPARAYQMRRPDYTFRATGEFHILLVDTARFEPATKPTFTVIVSP